MIMKDILLLKNGNIDFEELAKFYKKHLLQKVMPFWTEHCLDARNGGVNNIVDDFGNVLSTDRYLWSQGRVLWTLSALYECTGDKYWLAYADKTAEFLLKYGRNKEGRWYFKITSNGEIIEGPKCIYVDGFAIIGLTEYARVSKNSDAVKAALDTYNIIEPMLYDHAKIPVEPYKIPEGMQSQGIFMLFSHAVFKLGLLLNDRDIIDVSVRLADKIYYEHFKTDEKLIHEFVIPGGELTDNDAAKTVIPGHAIESMWSMESIYTHMGMKEKAEVCMEAVKWHLEKGWDNEYGGLFLAIHTQNGVPAWHAHDHKVWWPICESIYAVIRAYETTGKEWCLNWLEKLHNYAFSTFPNSEYNEWLHAFDRTGQNADRIAKIPVKDPFHLPRSLLASISSLERIEQKR